MLEQEGYMQSKPRSNDQLCEKKVFTYVVSIYGGGFACKTANITLSSTLCYRMTSLIVVYLLH